MKFVAGGWVGEWGGWSIEGKSYQWRGRYAQRYRTSLWYQHRQDLPYSPKRQMLLLSLSHWMENILPQYFIIDGSGGWWGASVGSTGPPRHSHLQDQRHLHGRIQGGICGADPGSGAFLILGSGTGKKLRSGSGMYIPDHISESFETIWNSLMPIRIRDPECFWPLDSVSGMGKKITIRIGDEHPGSDFRELRNNFLG